MAFQMKNLFSILFKTIVDILILTVVLATVIAILPNHLFINLPIDPIAYDTDFIADSLDNWNNLLAQRSLRLLEGHIVGPEAFAETDQHLYTGLADGRLVEIHKSSLKIRDVTTFGKSKDCVENEYRKMTECGRPLGLRFSNDGSLYVIDAFAGLFRVNVTTDVKELIDFKNDEIIGIFNDLVFDRNLNVVYISVSSTKWHLDRVPYSILDYEDTGYVFAYDFDKKVSQVLRKGFRFSNGIEISKDNKYLLIAETDTFTIHKIQMKNIHNALKDNKQIVDNEMEVFAKHLPAEPDNIRIDRNGDVWMGAFLVRTDGKSLRDHLSDWPFVRKTVCRVMYLASLVVDFINTNVTPNPMLQMLAFDLYSGHIAYKFMPKNGGVIKLDANTGKIKQILGSNQFNGISEVLVDSEGDLYFGSFRNQFIGKIERGDY
ncbi:adipocyte plasma membrane-associated protein-like [Oppia nitens]|uniref:adipocyte plasma membrane-associated protein-like n=1 Tax=Oppia nitens TaxID=1686743 RepID=UPI0023DB3341|nr:adipocyte plasma membrane-associated protein-like [Oppia nitens]